MNPVDLNKDAPSSVLVRMDMDTHTPGALPGVGTGPLATSAQGEGPVGGSCQGSHCVGRAVEAPCRDQPFLRSQGQAEWLSQTPDCRRLYLKPQARDVVPTLEEVTSGEAQRGWCLCLLAGLTLPLVEKGESSQDHHSVPIW